MEKHERHDVLDIETGNLYDRFSTEEDALQFVRAMMDANGSDIVHSIALGGRDVAGVALPVLTGAALAKCATQDLADLSPLSRSTRS